MTPEEAKEYVKQHIADYLLAKGIDLGQNYTKPFLCLCPDHNDSHASMSIDPSSKKAHCFSCGVNYDTFDLVAIDNNVALGSADAFKLAYEHFGLQVDKTQYQHQNHAKTDQKQQTTQKAAMNYPLEACKDLDLTEAALNAHAALLQNDAALQHFYARGLDLETIKQNMLGFSSTGCNAMLEGQIEDLKARGQKAGLYQYIIPIFDKTGTCIWYQAEISDRTKIDEWNKKYKKPRRTEDYGGHRIWGGELLTLKDSVPSAIFVCEGEIDAMSIEQTAGHKKCAVALGGAGGTGRLLGLCQKHKPQTTFILTFDPDTAGDMAVKKLKAGMDQLGMKYKVVTTGSHGHHDANDFMLADKEGFGRFVANAIDMATAEQKKAEEAARREYADTFAVGKISHFLDLMQGKGATPAISTGIEALDAALDGGLYAGLIIVGAISSLGKTTFILQLADTIAAAGTDVLFFSLETPYTELMAKSISRLTYENSGTASGSWPQTARNVLSNRPQYHGRELDQKNKALATQHVLQCVTNYASYTAPHIKFFDRQHDCGVADIAAAVAEHKKHRPDKRLVVFVDYLQILAKANERYTDKQNTDEALKALALLAHNEKVPVVAISSINRASYTDPIALSSFKESGNIEYDADVALGLQFAGMDYEDSGDKEEKDADRKSRVRKLIKDQQDKGGKGGAQQIQLKVLKQRLAPKTSLFLDFVPAYSCYKFKPLADTAAADPEEEEGEAVDFF